MASHTLLPNTFRVARALYIYTIAEAITDYQVPAMTKCLLVNSSAA